MKLKQKHQEKKDNMAGLGKPFSDKKKKNGQKCKTASNVTKWGIR